MKLLLAFVALEHSLSGAQLSNSLDILCRVIVPWVFISRTTTLFTMNMGPWIFFCRYISHEISMVYEHFSICVYVFFKMKTCSSKTIHFRQINWFDINMLVRNMTYYTKINNLSRAIDGYYIRCVFFLPAVIIHQDF